MNVIGYTNPQGAGKQFATSAIVRVMLIGLLIPVTWACVSLGSFHSSEDDTVRNPGYVKF